MTEQCELDALWWLLFDALGYAAGVDESGEGAVGRLIRPDGTEMVAGDAGSFIRFYWNLPDWPTDEGAALALCLEIIGIATVSKSPKGSEAATRGNYQAATRWPPTRPREWLRGWGATPAEALARLALAATRGE